MYQIHVGSFKFEFLFSTWHCRSGECCVPLCSGDCSYYLLYCPEQAPMALAARTRKIIGGRLHRGALWTTQLPLCKGPPSTYMYCFSYYHEPLERLTPCKASVVLHRKPSWPVNDCIVLCNTGMNTRWALTQRSLPDNRLIKTGGWALAQGCICSRQYSIKNELSASLLLLKTLCWLVGLQICQKSSVQE